MTIQTETIWNDMHSALKGFIVKRVPDLNTAEDILQDTFLQIHRHIDTLHDETKLESWIYQITRNAIIDYYRSNKSTRELSEALMADDMLEHGEDLAQQLAPCVRHMVQDLPAMYREALQLTEYEGITQNELAVRLGISVSGAKSRVQRAREQLREELLACCRFELDRRGKIIDYVPNCSCGATPSTQSRYSN